MFWESGNPLTCFLRPECLALLPLAILPFVRESIRPVTFAAVAAGWDADRHAGRRRFRFERWIVPALLTLGVVSAILALAGPVRPVIAALSPPRRGHFWSVVLDCSGSMSVVDPGRNGSRLRILADDLAVAVAARPHDRFAVVRVAGYADRLGPSSTSSRFMMDALKHISPALPGEDGTSLGDGLVLAAEALTVGSNGEARSILIVSDGRENPPEVTSFRLADVVPQLLNSRIRVDWLRLDMSAEPDESPASLALGEASRQLLETLVSRSGGVIIDSEAGSDRTAIVDAAMANFAVASDDMTDWTSAASACLMTAFVFRAGAALMVLKSFRKMEWKFGLHFQGAASAAAIGGIAAATGYAMLPSRIVAVDSRLITSRWLIVLDASPSMAATDAAHGSRLAAAKELAQSLIRRLSLEPGARAAIVRFSGRAIPESGWTDDWHGLEEIVSETRTDTIRPTGSDWDAALRAISNAGTEDEPGANVTTHVVFLTDGEASRGPADDIMKELAGRRWQLHFVTFGDDAGPGATFPKKAGSNLPWQDRRNGRPARSYRNDDLAKGLAGMTGGKLIAAGSADFESWELAQAIAGPVEPASFRNPASRRRIGRMPMRLTILAIVSCLIGECAGLFAHSKRRIGDARWHSAVSVLLLLSTSCSQPERQADFETFAKSAWAEYGKGDLTRAEAILNEGSARIPDEPGFGYDIALIAAIRNLPVRARESLDDSQKKLDRAEGIEPQKRQRVQARIQALRGYVEMQSGNADQAAEWYSKAISSGGLTETELAEARTNANHLARISKTRESAQNDGPGNQRLKLDPDAVNRGHEKLEPEPDADTWNRMADEARGRARAARSRFEPAGDETKSISKNSPGISDTIDW